MFKIDSLSEISQEGLRTNSDKKIPSKKIETENEIKVFQIPRISNALKQNENKTTKISVLKDIDKSFKTIQSFSNFLGGANQIKSQKSLSPNALRRKVGDTSPVSKISITKDKFNDEESFTTYVKINNKKKQDLDKNDQIIGQKVYNQQQNDSNQKNIESSSSIESKAIPPSINIIKSRSSMVLIKQIQKGKAINFKHLQKIEDSDTQIEPMCPEIQKISDDLMQGETDIVKISHQPLFNYIKQFNQNKKKNFQNQEWLDDTEQIKLLLLMLKYVSRQDTIFSKIIRIIRKEISNYLFPEKRFDTKLIQNYAQELYSLLEEEKPKISIGNYKQISQILFKCMKYYQSQNFMSYSNLVQQKQMLHNLNELHSKQLNAERAEKNKILEKDLQIDKLIQEQLLSQEKSFLQKINQLKQNYEQKILKLKEDCIRKQQEILYQKQQHLEQQNQLIQKSNSFELQLTDIIEKIRQRRYNVLFQQIVQSSSKNYYADASVQCDMQIDMRIKFPYKSKLKKNIEQE